MELGLGNMDKTYADLIQELRWLGPAVVMELMNSGTTKNCQTMSLMVGNYLIEKGFFVNTNRGAGKYSGHYDLAVRTADRGWYSVDPTYIQFYAPISPSAAVYNYLYKNDLEDKITKDQYDKLLPELFEKTIRWSVQGILEGEKAFEILPAPHIPSYEKSSKYEGPRTWSDGNWRAETWTEEMTKLRTRAEKLARGIHRETFFHNRSGPAYWDLEVARRLQEMSSKGNPRVPAQHARNNLRESEEPEHRQPVFRAYVYLSNSTVIALNLSDKQHLKLLRRRPEALVVLKELLDNSSIKTFDIVQIRVETEQCEDENGYPDRDNPHTRTVYVRRLVRSTTPPAVQPVPAESATTPTETSGKFRWLTRSYIYPNNDYMKMEYRTELPSDWLNRRGINRKHGIAYVIQNRKPLFGESGLHSKKIEGYHYRVDFYLLVDGVKQMGFIDEDGKGLGTPKGTPLIQTAPARRWRHAQQN